MVKGLMVAAVPGDFMFEDGVMLARPETMHHGDSRKHHLC